MSLTVPALAFAIFIAERRGGEYPYDITFLGLEFVKEGVPPPVTPVVTLKITNPGDRSVSPNILLTGEPSLAAEIARAVISQPENFATMTRSLSIRTPAGFG